MQVTADMLQDITSIDLARVKDMAAYLLKKTKDPSTAILRSLSLREKCLYNSDARILIPLEQGA